MNAPISIPPQQQVVDELDWRDPTLWPDVNKLVTEDDTPVDNPYSEKQMRLLTDPLYSSWPGPGEGLPFRVLANVGLYQTDKEPLVPDVMLGLGVRTPEQLMVKGHRAWFIWIVGRKPDLVLEIVSNQKGGEDTTKLAEYETIGIPYYVIYDPGNQFLGNGELRAFVLHARKYVPVDPRWLPDIGLGLVMWEGLFEDHPQRWLRWCDEKGIVIPTGLERARQAEQTQKAAEQAQKAAEQAQKAAEQAQKAAEQSQKAAEERAEQLAAKLRELGHDARVDDSQIQHHLQGALIDRLALVKAQVLGQRQHAVRSRAAPRRRVA